MVVGFVNILPLRLFIKISMGIIWFSGMGNALNQCLNPSARYLQLNWADLSNLFPVILSNFTYCT